MTRYLTIETAEAVLNPEIPRRYGLVLILIGTSTVPAAVWYGLSPTDAATLSILLVYTLVLAVAAAINTGETHGGL